MPAEKRALRENPGPGLAAQPTEHVSKSCVDRLEVVER